MKHLRTFESNDERSEMIDKLCEMGYDKATCDTMSYEELCDCMEKELTKEDTDYNQEEMVEEGLFKKIGEVLGIKGMDRRVEDYLGISEDGFNPTNKAKIFISQGAERNSLPTEDINKIGEALMKAKEVGYGLSFWKDGCDLKDMKGTPEEKKIAEYLINRAVFSIHSTSSGGGHNFGQRPNISGLSDNTSHSNLKHLKSFESFAINEEEGVFKKFFTGHASSEEKEAAKQKFMDALESAEAALKKDPEDYAQSKNWESAKEKLMSQAKDNNYKGGLRVQRGGRDPRVYIVYDEGVSGFQKMAGSAAGEVNVRK